MISLVVPTLGNRREELKRLFNSLMLQEYKDFEVIVVSQDNHNLVEQLLKNVNFKYKHVKIERKGLSHARNVGMRYVEGDIVSFSDDDCWYPPNSLQRVYDVFSENEGDIICFQIYDPIQKVYYKNYSKREENPVSFRGLLNKSSIEIFVNLNKVKKEHIRFDENFGLGTKFPSGEENIFLTDLYKKRYVVRYIPEIIVFHKKKSETEIKFSKQYFVGKGPMFKRIFNSFMAIILIIVFFIRKYPKLEEPVTSLLIAFREIIRYKKSIYLEMNHNE
ncbi:glycosyltransferase family 2 protein [Geobacillus kaustophilus]|uniref:glycosyltransferase family 2 protein n=1 Tax=Geobacillus kaustophilus TaxID=1462 RepID=UPI0027DB65C1|nr:glycosyltransferase family 2 protein [Geobacillus kaustophilus]WMJ19872.1 glycosyltransferase family 2 protein [Geobacillus kaustophilus]